MNIRIRLQDVARRAEVSMQTVSRVIRTPHLVAPETATRVRQVMEELGYVKNEQATALRLGRARTIGLLMPLIARPFWSEFVAGAESYAHEQGYSSLLCDTGDSKILEEEYISLLLGYQVSGIIYAPTHDRSKSRPGRSLLIQSGTPTVVISVYPDDLPCDHVRTDDYRAGYVLVRHLLDLGHRRIVIVTDNVGPSYERVQGAYKALQEAGIQTETPSVFLASDTYEGGQAVGQKLVQNAEPLPEAIFATTDLMALGLMEALHAQGVRIPEDIAIASHDGLHASAFVTPPLTTVAPRAREMGKASVERLIRSYADPQPPTITMIEADLLVRASTIGSGRAAFHTFSTPISASDAWSRWRSQSVSSQDKSLEVTCLTFEQVFQQRKEEETFIEK